MGTIYINPSTKFSTITLCVNSKKDVVNETFTVVRGSH